MAKPSSAIASANDDASLSLAMKVRIYPTKVQRQQWSTAFWASHRFRNAAVAFLKGSRQWKARHPVLARDPEGCLEEYAGSVESQLSRWLTAQLECARSYAVKLPQFQEESKLTLVDAVSSAWTSERFRAQLRQAEADNTPGASLLYLLTLPRTALDQVCQDLKKTCAKASKDRAQIKRTGSKKKPAGFPDFQKWSYAHSVRFQVDANKNQNAKEAWAQGVAFLPWAGTLRVRDDRALPEVCPKLITLARDAGGRWHASFAVDGTALTSNQPRPAVESLTLPHDPDGTPTINGMDPGLIDTAARSNGKKSGRTRYLKKYAKRLRQLNKTQARRKKGSGRWKANRRQLGKLHVRIADCREAGLRELAQEIVAESAILCLEDLNLRALLQTRLAGSFADAALGRLKQLIQHYARLQGKLVLLADRFDPTTQTCMCCGETTKFDLSVRIWTCPHCQAKHDRDTNAANAIVVFALLSALTGETHSINSTGAAKAKAAAKTVFTGERPEEGVGRAKHKLHPDLDTFLARGGLASALRQRTVSWSRETRNGQRVVACLEQVDAC